MTDWFVFTLMSLTVYRATRLVTKDTFPPVLWMRDRLAGGWRPLTLPELERYGAANQVDKRRLRDRWSYDPDDGLHQRYVKRRDASPFWLAELVSCPWCASGWIAGALTAVVDLTYGVPVPGLTGPAVWAAGALLASQEWS